MEIQDYSNLKAPQSAADAEVITIPLNGQVYYALPKNLVPAGVIADATGVIASEDISQDLLVKAMDETSDLPDVDRARAAVAGNKATARIFRFFDQVLEPESQARWAANLRNQGDAGILIPQVVAVFRDLVKVYSGQRPTTAPSSSSAGHGAATAVSPFPVPTSTAGALQEA